MKDNINNGIKTDRVEEMNDRIVDWLVKVFVDSKGFNEIACFKLKLRWTRGLFFVFPSKVKAQETILLRSALM